MSNRPHRLGWLALALFVGGFGCSDHDAAKKDDDDSDSDSDAGVDAGGVSDQKVAFAPGDPVNADDMTWTYVGVPGTACRDGNETGFGININPDSDKLIIYLEGGGACFNNLTCLANPNAWGEADLGTPGGVMSRDANNPFADWNLVYMPYCTGDVFSGSKGPGEGYGGDAQQGYINVGLYLERIVPTFPKVKEIVLSGSSAGGFGVAWNVLRTQDAFGDIPVHTLDDSGPPLGPEQLSPCMQQRLGELWGWDKTLHPACTDCDLETGDIVVPSVEVALNRADGQRFAVLSNDEDGVIKTFLSYGLSDCENFEPQFLAPAFPSGLYPQGLAALRDRTADFPDFALFEVQGGGHTFLGSDLSAQAGGVTLRDWLVAFRDGSSDFVNVTP